jgi:DNA-binding response OmpR family regulator
VTLPRVVVVEDDASIRAFVSMALEDLPVECITCESIAAALAALNDGPAVLVITDLMLGGESGLALTERLANDSALRGNARVAVFSAGLNAELNEVLSAQGVWRLLHKPVSLAALEACVRDALGQDPPTQSASAPPPVASDPHARAIQEHFCGDGRLYHQFRSACLVQFGADAQAGDLACQRGDAASLRRIAHSLKSVLLTLGDETESALAARIEALAAAGDFAEARRHWGTLQAHLLRWHATA